MKKYLNDVEVDKVMQFNADEVMREAVKKVLLEGLYSTGVLEAGESAEHKNWAYNLGGLNDKAMTNEVLGGLLKATVQGIAILEDGFNRLSDIKREEPMKEEGNPAE